MTELSAEDDLSFKSIIKTTKKKKRTPRKTLIKLDKNFNGNNETSLQL